MVFSNLSDRIQSTKKTWTLSLLIAVWSSRLIQWQHGHHDSDS